MPVVDGKVRRARFTRLSLKELSSVDNPAQPGATMAIMKRATDKQYNPNQPRDPKGSETGGQWTGTGGRGGGGRFKTDAESTAEFYEAQAHRDQMANGKLALEHFGIETLETQNSDSLDFHDVSVRAVNDALTDAWTIGNGVDREDRNARRRDERAGAKEVSRIASERLGIETLESRNMDSSDFHNVAVWQINDALNDARNAGRRNTGVSEIPPLKKGLEHLAKYVCENDGAHSFTEVLTENKFSQEVWPCVDALSQSIRSIVGDTSLAAGEREAKISASVEQFLGAVREISPEVSKRLSELCRKREGQMPKTIEELQTEVGKLETSVADLTSKLTAAEEAKAKADAECATAKAALATATEESITVGDTEIKKSVVGPEQFAMAKALADERDMARLEKRAEADFRHVVGTTAEKAQVLRLVEALPADDPVRKSLESILTAAEKMTAQGFESLGAGGGATPTQKAAQSTFAQKVSEIAKRDSIPQHQAMSKARSEFPAEYEAAYGETQPAE